MQGYATQASATSSAFSLMREQSTSGSRLGAIVRFLSSPDAYGPRVSTVEVKETHMSWLFLTPDRVFKLKKPLRAPFLDFSTLAAREKFCREEVRLNRRLAPFVYLRARPVTRAADGGLSIAEDGEIVDWLVEMRRLPADKMLDQALMNGTAEEQAVDRALSYLFAFFLNAPSVAVEFGRYFATLERQHEESAALLVDKAVSLPRRQILETINRLREIIQARPDWLSAPVRAGRIVEGHGDLRPEHICLTEPPAIIDCLEFNEDLRLVDPFDELSYLAMECRLLGARKLANEIFARYTRLCGVRPPQILLDFYTAYRATIRARLAIAHIYDWPRKDEEKWTAQGRAYLCEAHAACLRMGRSAGL